MHALLRSLLSDTCPLQVSDNVLISASPFIFFAALFNSRFSIMKFLSSLFSCPLCYSFNSIPLRNDDPVGDIIVLGDEVFPSLLVMLIMLLQWDLSYSFSLCNHFFAYFFSSCFFPFVFLIFYFSSFLLFFFFSVLVLVIDALDVLLFIFFCYVVLLQHYSSPLYTSTSSSSSSFV